MSRDVACCSAVLMPCDVLRCYTRSRGARGRRAMSHDVVQCLVLRDGVMFFGATQGLAVLGDVGRCHMMLCNAWWCEMV